MLSTSDSGNGSGSGEDSGSWPSETRGKDGAANTNLLTCFDRSGLPSPSPGLWKETDFFALIALDTSRKQELGI
jgi:hypothetical protein